MSLVPAKLQPAVERVRACALRYPQTREDAPFGFCSFKVRSSGFVGLKWDATSILVSVKLPASGLAALALPFTEPTHGGLGKSGWVSARFNAGEVVPVALLESWIDESFRAVAPKSLSGKVPARGGPLGAPPTAGGTAKAATSRPAAKPTPAAKRKPVAKKPVAKKPVAKKPAKAPAKRPSGRAAKK